MTNQQRVNLRDVVATKVLRVPDYQRPYAWGLSQLQDLWDDLDLAGPRSKHYAGTLIFKPSLPPSTTVDKYGVESVHTEVVDGQQRLTTCLLLVDRIRRRMFDLADAGVDDARGVAADLYRSFGDFEDEDHVKVTRLTPGPEVEPYWRSMLTDTPFVGNTVASHHRLTAGARFFDSKLDEMSSSSDASTIFSRLKDLLRRVTANLQFLVYDVESMADVGVIFETLNDRGHPLSELEKTKNYLLYLARQIEPANLGENLAAHINDNWAIVFTNLADLGNDAEDQLLRSHWLATRDPDPRTWKGIASIKRLFDRSDYVPGSVRLRPRGDSSQTGSVEAKWLTLNRDLRDYASQLAQCSLFLRESLDPHARYVAFGDRAPEVRRRASALQRTGITAGYRPLIFGLRLRHPNDGKVFVDLLRLCENYSTRVLLIMRYRTNAGQNRLFSLGHQMFVGTEPDLVLDDMRRLLLNWAPDDVVRAALRDSAQDWYNRRGHKYVLYEYELSLVPDGATVRSFETFTSGTKVPAQTTEHIYPQHPVAESWTTEFVTPEQVALRHSLGNLVLTLDNSRYSNKPFLDKRGTPLGPRSFCYAQSSLRQEQELAHYDAWTPAAVEARLRHLSDWAMDRWRVDPPVDGSPLIGDEDVPEFEDEIEPEIQLDGQVVGDVR